ncbi:odorant receptor 42a-like isoform X2 [Cataglyphis hispanica]|uniref:odorant receptor 42a-like isoform X2 n=1 Tax=Cataglyphis hispanica TaxID=1086592 RepID=UPI00217F71E6|nr:odorant receptor 42a-like isoform X2 [Cataglyphis hispanica]
MEFSLDRYYKLNRLLLSVIGLWPYQSAMNAWFHRVLAASFMIWSIIGQLRSLLDHIKADWERTRSQDEIKIMREYAASARIITTLFSFYVIVGTSMYIIITSIPQILDVFLPLNESRSREHPFHIELFIDEEKYFYLIRIQMYIMLLVGMGMIIANGTIFVVYTQHASGMFTILGCRAERLFNQRSSKTGRSIRGTEKDYRNIVLFIEDHRSVIQFVDIIQSSYSFHLLSEYLFFMILIGLTLVQIIKFSGLSDRPIRSIAFIIGQLFYLLMFSYMGQHIIDTSVQLSTKLYCGKWHNMSVWKQKIMLFVMIRCTRTVSINSCSIYTLSLETFSTVSKISAIYRL